MRTAEGAGVDKASGDCPTCHGQQDFIPSLSWPGGLVHSGTPGCVCGLMCLGHRHPDSFPSCLSPHATAPEKGEPGTIRFAPINSQQGWVSTPSSKAVDILLTLGLHPNREVSRLEGNPLTIGPASAKRGDVSLRRRWWAAIHLP